MDALLLVVVPVGGRSIVAPRRIALQTRQGEGRLLLAPTPVLDDAARASLSNAWASAKALAGREDLDLAVSIAGATPLHGASAGLTTGLCALGLLLGRPISPFFATGGVSTPHGDLEGGHAAREKAQAAASLAPQVGLEEPLFLTPPIPAPPVVPPLRVHIASDLGSAYARLDPEGYAGIAERHRAVRASSGPAASGWVHAEEGGLVLWRTRDPTLAPYADALGRAGSVLAR